MKKPTLEINKKFGKSNHRWKGYEGISASDFGKIKSHAEERNIPFNITIEEAWNLFVKQDRKCALTNLPIKFRSSTMIWDGDASLDRIDNSGGYTAGNIQWVHKDINKMKMNFTEEKLIEYCKLICKHRKLL
jgi:hypothetical protein